MKNAMGLVALSLILAACGTRPPPTPLPTQAPVLPATATQPATAEPTSTAAASPSPTATEAAPVLPPTETPSTIEAPSDTPQPVPTATLFAFQPPTPTSNAARDLDCAVMEKTYADFSIFNPREHFTTGWKIENTGSATWLPGSVTFSWVGGTNMQFAPTVFLQGAVSPGQEVTLTVEMRTPATPSSYTTWWALHQGDNYFCRTHLTLTVELP